MTADLILGINAYHADAAACVVRDGKLIAAAEEERFRRIKHWAGFPSQALTKSPRQLLALISLPVGNSLGNSPKLTLLR